MASSHDLAVQMDANVLATLSESALAQREQELKAALEQLYATRDSGAAQHLSET